MRYDPSIRIRVPDTVYDVGEDSILLIESLDVEDGEDVLEIGCGSGVVSLHCAKNGCRVTAVDVNPNAVEAARTNAEANALPLDVRLSDVYGNVDGTFDLIVFNLPYLPVEETGLMEASWSGGPDGLGPLPRLLDGAGTHLREGGRIAVVVSSLMDGERLDGLLEGFDTEVVGELSMFFERLRVLEIRVSSRSPS